LFIHYKTISKSLQMISKLSIGQQALNGFKKVNVILTPTVVKDSILAIGVTKVYPHGFDN
jgi:hypothetical protein